AAEEHVRPRHVEARRDDDDRPPAALPREPGERAGLARGAERLRGEADDGRARVPTGGAEPLRLRPVLRALHRREREHGRDASSDQREGGGSLRLLPESTTITSARFGAPVSQGDHTKRTAQSTSQSTTSPAGAATMRRSTGRRYSLRP